MNALRLLVIFTVAFSLAGLSGPLAGNLRLPSVQLANANVQNCQTKGSSGDCSEFWYPAGPAMNTFVAPIFTDATSEYLNLQSSSPSIDLTDSQLAPSLIPTFNTSPNFLVTAPVNQSGYAEIQFMQANNFWGCPFQYGTSSCGVQVRQGIAHMIDKKIFAAQEPDIAGTATAIDNPVPNPNTTSLPPPNPCNYDTSFTQTGTQCVVGASGGTAYRLQKAAGANGFSWLQAPGSQDLNAAAQHFVNAGIATGFNSATSVLTGISSSASAAGNVPMVFVRNDNIALLDLGNSLMSQICYLFTGSYTVPCMYLSLTRGPVQAFQGRITSTTAVNLNWWMYTAAYTATSFYHDNQLQFNYDSRYVSGIPAIQLPTGLCSTESVSSASADNYMYTCAPAYDSLSAQTENAPCITAAGDPVPGATSNLPTPPGNGLCTGTSQLSAMSAGIQAEAFIGANVLTLPIFQINKVQFGYLNGWTRIANSATQGLPNYFTWLNAYNPTPSQTGTVRQGLAQQPLSVSPYIASTPWETYIEGNVYDTLLVSNPLDPSQFLNWMTVTTLPQIPNASLSYTPPAGTVTTYRFTLRGDVFFQDERQVTTYDVAFSYLSMVATGAPLGAGAASITGITILNPSQIDIGVSQFTSHIFPGLTSIPIVPGRYWTNAGSTAWDSAITTCTRGQASCSMTQYTLSGSNVNCALSCSNFPASLMQINPTQATATYDPIQSHTFVGSGPWTCGTVTSNGSGTCTSSGTQNPGNGGTFTLPSFGIGLAPGSSLSGTYFRSSGNMALWYWSCLGDNNFNCWQQILNCYQLPVNLSGPCGHWQQGIGNPGPGPTSVGLIQIGIVERFYGNAWASGLRFSGPGLDTFSWPLSPPLGMAAIPPVLYEGSATLNPASVVGCTALYPAGGYDC